MVTAVLIALGLCALAALAGVAWAAMSGRARAVWATLACATVPLLAWCRFAWTMRDGPVPDEYSHGAVAWSRFMDGAVPAAIAWAVVVVAAWGLARWRRTRLRRAGRRTA